MLYLSHHLAQRFSNCEAELGGVGSQAGILREKKDN